MPAQQSTRPALRRRALVTAVGLTLLGGGLPTAAAADSGPDLSRFHHQKITWSPCRGKDVPRDLECGKVTVPLDYAKPASGTISLALARYRATGRSRGSLLLNFGGPGGSGVSELALGGKDFMSLTNGYDVVSFDPRGVGRSAPVTCGDGLYGGSAGAQAGTGNTLDDPQAVLGLLRKAAQACAQHSGPVLRHIGTVDAARDMDVIRQALGDKKLNYLGFSYGTRLGAVYAARFPDRVGRMALDGVDTLTEPLAEQGVAGAAGQQVALDDFVDWCVQDIACPFGQDARTAGEQIVQLVRSLDEEPMPTDFGEQFTGQDLVAALSQGLYSEKLWPLLERSLAELVEDGSTGGIMQFVSGGSALPVPVPLKGGPPVRQQDLLPSRRPTVLPVRRENMPPPSVPRAGSGLGDEADIPADNFAAALVAINCADDPDRPGAAQVTKDLSRLRSEYDQASPVFGEYRLTQVLMCYGRPKGTAYIRDDVKNLTGPKMLLVGTRGDPATPYRWTVETAKRLGSSAVVLDNRGDGHTGYTSSKCVHGKVDDFLLYGSLPPNGSSCGPDGND
ncbi:alpha/beta hydrolase [Streptomyces adustus]|uniref:Alpha/beta hydrolase n=1 Tax=Streptomyces adustus TaxID=1609272 RepID=A0A5N8VGQ5_9ACTN|nr:alpha/beta hydrolase [Streptomyces adustus]MPY33842.1 alpha/beta hydrolase [Streptomyces adustus]